MSKFEDIKVGDTVYIQEAIYISWRRHKHFFIPKKVERVTKTQFKIEGGLAFNKNGREKGNIHRECFKLGEKPSHSNCVVYDQTEEMATFEEKRAMAKIITAKVEQIKINSELPMSLQDLQDIDLMIDSILQKLDIEP